MRAPLVSPAVLGAVLGGASLPPAPPLTLPAAAAEIVRLALAGRRHDELLLVLDPDGLDVELRADRAAHLRRCGVHDLARQVATVRVPPGCIAVLVDTDQGTGVRVIRVADLLGPAPHPPCSSALAAALAPEASP